LIRMNKSQMLEVGQGAAVAPTGAASRFLPLGFTGGSGASGVGKGWRAASGSTRESRGGIKRLPRTATLRCLDRGVAPVPRRPFKATGSGNI